MDTNVQEIQVLKTCLLVLVTLPPRAQPWLLLLPDQYVNRISSVFQFPNMTPISCLELLQVPPSST